MEYCKVESINDERVAIFSKYNERQLLHYYEPNGGIFIAETFMVIKRALDRGCQVLSLFLEESYLKSDEFVEISKQISSDCVCYYSSLDVMNKLTGFSLSRGVLCAFIRPTLPSVDEICSFAKKIVILEDVLNPTNVGAIFRSAAALGADAILLSKESADPFYRRASRVAMGTTFQIPWTYLTDEWLDKLHENSYKIIGMALVDDAVQIDNPLIKQNSKMAVVMGTEAFGIKESTLNKCDYKVIIPMSNEVDSLNVAAASAVAVWELFKR